MSKVRYKSSELPALTPERQAELNALVNKPDSEINYHDIPPLDEAFWLNAVRNRFYKPTKTHASVRIDSDVWHGLKAKERAIRPV